MANNFSAKRGFSLLEAILYLGIFSIVGTMFIAILTNITKIGTSQSSSNELISQINSATQTINRLIKQSSAIDISASTTTTNIKLRMKNSAIDPTCIYVASGTIKLAQGPNPSQPQNCKTTALDLTTSKVIVDKLEFSKTTFYPGHDEIFFTLQMTYNSQNVGARISRIIRTAVSRVAAATFDDNLLPGTSDSYDMGISNSKWRSINGLIYFSGNNVGVGIQNPAARFQVSGGNIYASDAGGGLIAKSPNGSLCATIGINNSGVVTATAITCP